MFKTKAKVKTVDSILATFTSALADLKVALDFHEDQSKYHFEQMQHHSTEGARAQSVIANLDNLINPKVT